MAPDVENSHARARVGDPTPRLARPATLAVAVGALIGTGARVLVGLALAANAGAWPWSTLTVNVTGSFVLGAVFGWADRNRAPAWLRGPGFTTGVVGSFTTFSALALEAAGLTAAGAVGYAAVSLAGGLLAVALGWRTGRGRP